MRHLHVLVNDYPAIVRCRKLGFVYWDGKLFALTCDRTRGAR